MSESDDLEKQAVNKIIDAYIADIERQKKLPPDPEDKKKRFLPFRITEMNTRTIRKDLEVVLAGNERAFLDQVAVEARMHHAIEAILGNYNPDKRANEQAFDPKRAAQQYTHILKAEQTREQALAPLDKILARDSQSRIRKGNEKDAAAARLDALKGIASDVLKEKSKGAGVVHTLLAASDRIEKSRFEVMDEFGAGAGIVAYNVARDAINFAGRDTYKKEKVEAAHKPRPFQQIPVENAPALPELPAQPFVLPDKQGNTTTFTPQPTEHQALASFAHALLDPAADMLTLPPHRPGKTRGVA